MENDSALQAFLAEHPRMIGVLFTLVLLLTQIGAVAAESQSGGTTIGP